MVEACAPPPPPESKGSSACREVRILPLMQHVWHAVQCTVLGEKGKEGFCLHSEKRPFDNCVSRASEPLHTWGLSPSHHRLRVGQATTLEHRPCSPGPEHAQRARSNTRGCVSSTIPRVLWGWERAPESAFLTSSQVMLLV